MALARSKISCLWLPLLSIFFLLAATTPSIGSAIQTNSTPSADDGDVLFGAEGVSSRILARADFDTSSAPSPYLLLERIEAQAGATLPERTTGTAELVYVQSGTVSYNDTYGFTIVANSGQSLELAPGTTYLLQVGLDQPAIFYRLRLSPPEDTVEPPDESLSTSPVAQTIVINSLISQPLNESLGERSTLFIAQATFSPGATTGTQLHSGPLGIYVEAGTLSVATPSGASGQLGAGFGATLPSHVPLVATNEGQVDVVATIVGIVPADVPLFELFIPTPTPTSTATPTSTPTPLPTSTPTATPTPTPIPSPTSTPLPTATPEPTSTPTPSPTPTPIPTPTPTPTPVAAYVAEDGVAFDAWVADSSWIVYDGMLIFSGDDRAYSQATLPLRVSDGGAFAVEFEARVISTLTCGAFGVSTRGSLFGSYNVAINWLGADCTYNFMNSETVGNGSRLTLAAMNARGEPVREDTRCTERWLSRTCPWYIDHAPFSPESEWHTYRVEVAGPEIRVYVDGRLILQGIDTTFQEGGTVGLWSNGAQFAVRRFVFEADND